LQSQVEEQQYQLEQLSDKLAERKRAKTDEDTSAASERRARRATAAETVAEPEASTSSE
jgi:hypothetical protein